MPAAVAGVAAPDAPPSAVLGCAGASPRCPLVLGAVVPETPAPAEVAATEPPAAVTAGIPVAVPAAVGTDPAASGAGFEQATAVHNPKRHSEDKVVLMQIDMTTHPRGDNEPRRVP